MFPSADTPHHARLADTRTTRVSGAAGGSGHRGFHLSSEPRSKGDQSHQGAGILSEEEKNLSKNWRFIYFNFHNSKNEAEEEKEGGGGGCIPLH